MSEYIITDEQIAENQRLHGKKLLVMPVIVRCRDCKHYTEDEAEYWHYCGEWCGHVEPDGFCAWGERE